MIVRPEGQVDLADIRRLTEAAFGGPAEADLVDALRAEGHAAISLVAEGAGRIVGHVLFSRLVAPAGALALAPLSVDPARQKQGVGARLVRCGLDAATRDGWDAVFVVGEPAYYRRFGFQSEVAASFRSPYPPQYVMALELKAGVLAGQSGEVVYAAPFQTLD